MADDPVTDDTPALDAAIASTASPVPGPATGGSGGTGGSGSGGPGGGTSGGAGAPAGTGTGGGAAVVNFSIDATRKELAYLLLYVMIGVIVVIVIVSILYSLSCWNNAAQCTAATNALGVLTSSISPIFTAMVGLVGSVVGFYFGSKQSG